jgi:hypothetical protein
MPVFGDVKGPRVSCGEYAVALVETEAKKAGRDWLLLRLGLFGGSLDELLKLKAEFDQLSRRAGF